MGKLLQQYKPHIYHCPDFHACIAPWYALQNQDSADEAELRMLLVLHNAEYQGSVSTDMVRQRHCEKVARIFNVSQQFIFQHLTAEGRFNMLKAGVDYLLEHQEWTAPELIGSNDLAVVRSIQNRQKPSVFNFRSTKSILSRRVGVLAPCHNSMPQSAIQGVQRWPLDVDFCVCLAGIAFSGSCQSSTEWTTPCWRMSGRHQRCGGDICWFLETKKDNGLLMAIGFQWFETTSFTHKFLWFLLLIGLRRVCSRT